MAPINANGSFMLARNQSAYGPLTGSAGEEIEPENGDSSWSRTNEPELWENPMSRKSDVCTLPTVMLS